MHEGSDLDLLVSLRDGGDARALASRLTERLGQPVQLVELRDARRAPLLLAEVLREGRVLVDREQLWPALREIQPKVERAAKRERSRVSKEFAARFAA